MKEKPQFFIFNDNGTTLWTDPVEAENEPEAIEKATSLFHKLKASEIKERKSFLLCEGYDASDICGGFYEEDDSEGAWIIEKEIVDFLKQKENESSDI